MTYFKTTGLTVLGYAAVKSASMVFILWKACSTEQVFGLGAKNNVEISKRIRDLLLIDKIWTINDTNYHK